MKKYLLFYLALLPALFTSAQEVLHLQNGASVNIQNGAEVVLMGGIGLDDGSSLINNGSLQLRNNSVANQSNWTDNAALGTLSGNGVVIFNSTHTQNFSGATQFYAVRINAAGLLLQNDFSVSHTLHLINGRINTGNYYVLLNNDNPSSLVNDVSNTAYKNGWINGNFRRGITTNTSVYDFPVGNSTRCNLLKFINNNISGTHYLTASFGLKPGNDTGLNVAENGVVYNSVNNGGVWYLNPDVSPSGGKYSLQLYFNGFGGLTDNRFGMLRRDDASTNAADWKVPPGSSLEADNGLGRKLSDGFARRKNISTFSQWGIGEMRPATKPTVTINQALTQNDPTSVSPIHFTVTFSENVSGFNASDISFAGSTAGGKLKATVTGGPAIYNVAVGGMTSSGRVVATIPAGAAVNAASLSSRASTSTDNTVKFVQPTPLTVTINRATGQAEHTNSSPIKFTIKFSEPVVDFTKEDVVLTGTAGATSVVVTGSGSTYSAAVSGMKQSGTVIVTIPVNAAHKADGTGNNASTSRDNVVKYSLPPPIPVRIISIRDVNVYESEGFAILTVSLSSIAKEQVKVHYTTSDGTAVSGKNEKDYKSTKGTAIIPRGKLSTTISIRIYDDHKKEGHEYFYVTLSNPTHSKLGDATAKVTILDGSRRSSWARETSGAAENHSEEETVSRFDVKVYPNPSYSDFVLQIITDDNAPAEVRVVNSLGNEIEKFSSNDKSLRMGMEWKTGLYIVDVVQGLQRKTIKLIKY